jgi:cytochrome c-type biogenesis protein CcmE
VASRGNPARLVIALSVAAVLAIFLLYTSFAGGATPSLQPSELKEKGRDGRIELSGTVVGPLRREGRTIRFRLRDVEGTASVPVTYGGSLPDLFKIDRSIHLQGELRNGVFVGEEGTLVTKCPSKYAPKRDDAGSA